VCWNVGVLMLLLQDFKLIFMRYWIKKSYLKSFWFIPLFMMLYQFVLWSYSWEALRSFFYHYENLSTSCQLRGFCGVERYRCKGGEVESLYRKKLCHVLAFHHWTGRTEENSRKPHLSDMYNNFSSPNSSMGGTSIAVWANIFSLHAYFDTFGTT
jgi:hypothetical protein